MVSCVFQAGLAISTKADGLVWPRQALCYTGWDFDTNADGDGKLLVSIPEKKVQEGIRRIDSVLLASVVCCLALCSVIGYLCHLSEICVSGKRWLPQLFRIINSSGVHNCWRRGMKSDPVVTIDSDARFALNWWRAKLSRGLCDRNEVARVVLPGCGAVPSSLWTQRRPNLQLVESLLSSDISRKHIYVYESDASKLTGWSWLRCRDASLVSGLWDDDLLPVEINYKELLTIVKCFRAEAPLCKREGVFRVLVRCDNSSAVQAANHRTSSLAEMRKLCQELDAIEAEHGVLLLTTWISTHHNCTADAGSRESEFHMSFNRDPLRDVFLCDKVFASIMDRATGCIGWPLEVDMFACDDGSNSMLRSYFSPSRSAFLQPAPDKVGWYCFPPPALAGAWVRHVVKNNIRSAISILVMNPSMWKLRDTKFLEQHFAKPMMVIPANARCFCEFLGPVADRKRTRRVRCHYPVWCVHLR